MKKTPTATNEIAALREAQQAATRLAAAEQALRDQHATLTQERAHTWRALASRQEVHANAERLVRAERARFEADQAAGWVRHLSGYREARGLDAHERRVPPRLPDVANVVQAPGALSFRDLCGLAPDLVIDRLAALIELQPDDTFGLPDTARQARLAELDIAIADIEVQHTSLVDAAAEVGIALPLLTPVRDARAAAEAEDARQAALAEERRRTEALA